MPRPHAPRSAAHRGTARAAALLALAAAAAPALRAQTAERYVLRGRDAAVYDPAGRVQVVPGSGSDVTVEVTRGGRDGARLRVVADDVDGRPTLRVIAPDRDLVYPAIGRWSSTNFRVRDDGTFGGRGGDDGRELTVRGSGRGAEAWADVVVRVPAGSRVAVHLGVGKTEARDVSGDLALAANSGDVTAERTRGRLQVGTGSGDVEVRDASGDEVKIGTGSGDAEVRRVRAEQLSLGTGSGDVRGGEIEAGQARLGTGSGDMRLERVGARELRVGTGSGSVDLGLARRIDEARIATGSGDITLRVPSDFGATLAVSSGSGGVRSDLPLQLTRSERHRIEGRVGDGRARIQVSAGSGGVHLVSAR